MAALTALPVPDPAELPELFDRYTVLRDTIQGLEAEREALGAVIKAALMAGEHPENDIYRAILKRSKRVEYPVSRFREVFGDAAALEVASIDKKKAEALARSGDLDADRLRELAEVKELVSLVLLPKGEASREEA
ncbi:hypothetical protein MF271_10960 [Deinococcus sp. KNUC1210]|uniref:hypothetical protein n=1 Tax=Deinococcus sp. KNUC1210 TaxID=2917691 RepID=UPI001EEF9982|nr:hypothetical protein [Deinococcus sp. KNUC1210]ULH14542.1 hypothetical protein MF271_10960 [Deinococcus sp. KNUC1210]